MSILGAWPSQPRGWTWRTSLSLFRTLCQAGCLVGLNPLWGYQGTLVDAQSGAPIPEALVTLGDRTVKSDEGGRFHIEGEGDALKFRAPGFGRPRPAHP